MYKSLVNVFCQEMNKLHEESNDVNKRSSLLEKENQRARKQIADLSHQVVLADYVFLTVYFPPFMVLLSCNTEVCFLMHKCMLTLDR